MAPWWDWSPRPSAAQRRRDADAEKARLGKQGRALSPVVLRGHIIANTFWGKSWCENLERYSDFANRLPRGRSYLRSGSVVHLAVNAGAIEAMVRGSDLYDVTVTVAAVSKPHWAAMRRDSAGTIESLVELLQGRFPPATMERLCRQEGGLFPRPREIQFSCSCPDGAWMCKHVAAVLYGIGARLDAEPAILFRLRRVDEHDLISAAVAAPVRTRKAGKPEQSLAGEDLSALFGLELAGARPKKKAPKKAGKATVAKRKKAAKQSDRRSPSRAPKKAARKTPTKRPARKRP